MKKYIMMVIGLVLLVVSQVNAADINKDRLVWTWVPTATSGPIVDFEVRCGQTSKVYTKLTVAGATATSMPLSSAITGRGNWFCVVAARNQDGQVVSGEVPFVAGAAPVGTLNLTVQ